MRSFFPANCLAEKILTQHFQLFPQKQYPVLHDKFLNSVYIGFLIDKSSDNFNRLRKKIIDDAWSKIMGTDIVLYAIK